MKNQRQLGCQEWELSLDVTSAKVLATIGPLVIEGVPLPHLLEAVKLIHHLVLQHLLLLLLLLLLLVQEVHLVLNKAALVAKESSL